MKTATEVRDGRLYLATTTDVPTIPYAFAVDRDARESEDRFDDNIVAMTGFRYCGPVEGILKPGVVPDAHPPIVVDVGSGSGKWVIEMATEFPNAQFVGIDLALGERDDVPDNVEFKIADFNQRWPFEDGSVDMVHMRQLQFGAPDYKRLLTEGARILRTGGLLLAGDATRYFVHDEDTNMDIEKYLPASHRYRKLLMAFLQEDGLHWSGESIPTMIAQVTSLKLLNSVVIALPVGVCPQPDEEPRPLTKVGIEMVDRALDAMSAFRPRFKQGGWSDDEYDDLVIEIEHELMTQPHITLSLYMSWATKS